MKQNSLFIHAVNVHQGGGKSLLLALLGVCLGSQKVFGVFDKRMTLPEEVGMRITPKFVKPSILYRLQAEWWLAQNVQMQDVVLCFGNLPPLFKLRGHVVVYVQNRYLIDDVKLSNFSLKTRLRLSVERLWLSARMANVDEFVVQTPSMKRLLEARTKGNKSIRVLPFLADNKTCERKVPQVEMKKEEHFDFIYVASGEPHKNHRQLIDAWCLLGEEGVFPSLKLTFDKLQFAELCLWVEHKIGQCHLNVENMGVLPHGQVRQLYDQAGALIYPSVFESLGLPLIEARQAGLPVLASELDYVRDVLDPEQTFDPESAVSIARAVKRFLKKEEQALPLQDATEFLHHILKRVK